MDHECNRRARLLPLLTMIVMLGAVAAAGAQGPTRSNAVELRQGNRSTVDRESDVEELVDASLALPVEIGADILLRLAESNQTNNDLRLHAIAASQSLIATVQHPLPQGLVLGADVESDSGAVAAGMSLRLDKVSLSLRRVSALLHFDQTAARAAFEAIDIGTRQLSCNTALVYRFDDYYHTLRDLYLDGFSSDERAQELDTVMLRTHVTPHNAGQIKPAADLLVSLPTRDDTFEELVYAFGDALSSMTVDDRSFSDNTLADIDAVMNLARVALDRHVPVGSLLDGLRRFIVRHTSGIRCSDTSTRASTVSTVSRERTNTIHLERDFASVAPLTIAEVTPTALQDSMDPVRYWQSRKSRSLKQELNDLRFEDGSREWGHHKSIAWRNRLREYLAELSQWRSSDEASAEEYWNEKAIVFESLMTISPDDQDRSDVISDFVTFLDAWYVVCDEYGEWLYRARQLLSPLFRNNSNSLISLELNPALRAYVALERITGHSF